MAPKNIMSLFRENIYFKLRTILRSQRAKAIYIVYWSRRNKTLDNKKLTNADNSNLKIEEQYLSAHIVKSLVKKKKTKTVIIRFPLPKIVISMTVLAGNKSSELCLENYPLLGDFKVRIACQQLFSVYGYLRLRIIHYSLCRLVGERRERGCTTLFLLLAHTCVRTHTHTRSIDGDVNYWATQVKQHFLPVNGLLATGG